MHERQIHVVTGAFGFSGKYIAHRLLTQGYTVRTLTHSMHRRNPFGTDLQAYPYHFEKPKELIRSLEGASVLYNTYWVRFNTDAFDFATAIENTTTLFEAAKTAGVNRIVHLSITNASEDSPLEYFRGKAKTEHALTASGISYSVLRPALIFGKGDVLINNIAWMLRRFPIFGVFGSGDYRLQPIYVDDLARLAVEQGERRENTVIDAVGPETFTYRELVETIGKFIGNRRPIVSISPAMGYIVARGIGHIIDDIVITPDEIRGLMAGLLSTDSPPAGATRLTEWLRAHAETLGKHYSSELARRTDRRSEYTALEDLS